MAIKFADLSGNWAAQPVYRKWVEALEEEMFLQGDEEKARNLPPSPLCDRAKQGVRQCQASNWTAACFHILFQKKIGTSAVACAGGVLQHCHFAAFGAVCWAFPCHTPRSGSCQSQHVPLGIRVLIEAIQSFS
jgi:hypothetical protein